MDIRNDELVNALHHYSTSMSTKPDPVLYDLERETGLKTLSPQMISGSLQGQFLQLISTLQQPDRILEVGTFTGYAAICMARGLSPDGELHTIEVNRELEHIIRKYLNRAQLEEKVHLHWGDALEIIPTLEGQFDLVFLDADKRQYQAYYELVVERVPSGGLILADNVLWSGKVLDSDRSDDADAASLHAFNQMVLADERVENVLVPLRDGLMMIRKL